MFFFLSASGFSGSRIADIFDHQMKSNIQRSPASKYREREIWRNKIVCNVIDFWENSAQWSVLLQNHKKSQPPPRVLSSISSRVQSTSSITTRTEVIERRVKRIARTVQRMPLMVYAFFIAARQCVCVLATVSYWEFWWSFMSWCEGKLPMLYGFFCLYTPDLFK